MAPLRPTHTNYKCMEDYLCRNDLHDLHLSILGYQERGFFFNNLKVGDYSPMQSYMYTNILCFSACANWSSFGDLLHVRKQPRNHMTFAIFNQTVFFLNATS